MTPPLPLRRLNRTRTSIPVGLVLVLAVLGPAAYGRAETGPETENEAPPPGVVVITGHKPAPGETGACVSEAASEPPSGGAELDYACLNARLAIMRSQTDPLPTHPSTEDLIGHGEPNKVGTFSYTGIRQQLGSSFGVSAIPQRPTPPPVYHPPLSAPPTAAPPH